MPPHLTMAEAMEAGRGGSWPATRVRYGTRDRQLGDLRLPRERSRGEEPCPVVVLIHGGCWQSMADRHYMAPLAERLTGLGWATWNLELRPVDVPGGGWPGTFLDVAAGIDFVRILARNHLLDPDRVVVLGHSSGGHLAFWAAARHRLPRGAPVASPDPLRPRAAVALAGIVDLAAFQALPSGRRACGEAVWRLLGEPEAVGERGPEHQERQERMSQASPAELLPLGIPQLLITGAADPDVPPSHGDAYVERATSSGDEATHRVLPDAGHFEPVAPSSPRWPDVEAVLLPFLRRWA